MYGLGCWVAVSGTMTAILPTIIRGVILQKGSLVSHLLVTAHVGHAGVPILLSIEFCCGCLSQVSPSTDLCVSPSRYTCRDAYHGFTSYAAGVIALPTELLIPLFCTTKQDRVLSFHPPRPVSTVLWCSWHATTICIH